MELDNKEHAREYFLSKIVSKKDQPENIFKRIMAEKYQNKLQN